MEVLKIFAIRADKHVAHEKSVVGTSTDDSDLDLVLLVPSCVTVDDVDAVSCVEVINGTLSVNSPDLQIELSAIDSQHNKIRAAVIGFRWRGDERTT